MSGSRVPRAAARYRPGKAPAPEVEDESDSDVPEGPEEQAQQVAPAPLPSHAVKPPPSAGVTIQRGSGAIELPQAGKGADTEQVPEDLSEYGVCGAVRRFADARRDRL